jgi:hypothetical protein
MAEKSTAETKKKTNNKKTTTSAQNKENTKLTNNNIADNINIDNLDLDKKVTVRNISDWNVSFIKKHEMGDITITRNSTQRISRNEIQAQVGDNNPLFTGIDGKGSHATLYIEDDNTRYWLGFDTDIQGQQVFTDEMAKELFEMPQADFEKKLPEYIVTRAEKYALTEAIKRLGFNDFRKIMFASNYTGYPLA